MKSVRETSICASSARIACGCVVSRTWNVSCRNVRLITSGASDEPPMPSRTTASTRSTTESANCSSRSTSSRMRHGSSSQPSQLPSSAPVQTPESRAQIRSTIVASRSRQRAALGADALDDLVERVGELLDALCLERLDDVVVVDAGLARAARAASAPRRRPRAPCRRAPRRDPGTPRSSRAASCSPSPGRSAPRRRSRRGSRGSSSTSTPTGSAASSRPCPRGTPSAGPENASR